MPSLRTSAIFSDRTKYNKCLLCLCFLLYWVHSSSLTIVANISNNISSNISSNVILIISPWQAGKAARARAARAARAGDGQPLNWADHRSGQKRNDEWEDL